MVAAADQEGKLVGMVGWIMAVLVGGGMVHGAVVVMAVAMFGGLGIGETGVTGNGSAIFA